MSNPRYNEDSDGPFTAVLTDGSGTAVPGSSLVTLTLKITDIDTKRTIRDTDDILVSATVPVSSAGILNIQLSADDNPIITPRRQVERHMLLFKYTWADGQAYLEQEVEVKNLHGGVGSPE